MIPDNAWILRITAAAGTELADPYSYSTVSLVHFEGPLQPADGIDGVDAADKVLLAVGLAVLVGLLWVSARS